MANYIIIGASSGIGQQLALQLRNAGHQVYATYFKNKLTSEKRSQCATTPVKKNWNS